MLGKDGDEFTGQSNIMADKFCDREGLICEEIDEDFVKERWSYIVPPENCFGRFTKKYNGHISIRNLVKACQTVAENNGVKRVLEVVKDVERTKECGFKIKLKNGDEINSKKVVVACGAFTNFFNVLPNKRPLDLQLVGHCVTRFELDDEDSKKMADLPCMNYKRNHNSSYVYILPPIKYPNGKTYLKIGHVTYPSMDENKIAQTLHSLDEVQQWYCQGEYPKAKKFFEKSFKSIYPGVRAISVEQDFCVMAMTTSRDPLIGFVEENFMVATGGNGKSAKFGLEIGRICADSIVSGRWSYAYLNEDDFKVRYKDEFNGY
jgi:glycine/D-amino acid oxidase-like deaminating enzyme